MMGAMDIVATVCERFAVASFDLSLYGSQRTGPARPSTSVEQEADDVVAHVDDGDDPTTLKLASSGRENKRHSAAPA